MTRDPKTRERRISAAQEISHRSMRELGAGIRDVGPMERLHEGDGYSAAIVEVRQGGLTPRRFLIEPGGCVAELVA